MKLKPVSRILNILIRIRSLGSVHWNTDLDLGPDPFYSSEAFKMPTKNKYFCLLLTVRTFTWVFKNNKSLRISLKTVAIMVFLNFFACWWKGSDPYRIRIRTNKNGFGSGRSKTYGSYGSATLHETSCPEVQFQPCLGIAEVQNAVNNILFIPAVSSIWKKEVALKLQRIVLRWEEWQQNAKFTHEEFRRFREASTRISVVEFGVGSKCNYACVTVQL